MEARRPHKPLLTTLFFQVDTGSRQSHQPCQPSEMPPCVSRRRCSCSDCPGPSSSFKLEIDTEILQTESSNSV